MNLSTSGGPTSINLLKEAQSEGATVLLGDVTRQGTLVQPHIVKNVKKGMKIWEKETFGPGTQTY